KVDTCSETSLTLFIHRSRAVACCCCWARLAQIEAGDAMGAVVHIEATVLDGRAKRDVLAAERFAEPPSFVLKVDEAVAADLAHMVVGCILDRWQDLRVGTWARPVALRRRRHAEGLVRSLVIVAWSPFVEGALIVGEITEALSVDNFCLESSVEAFLFALCLRMTRAPVEDFDAQ